MVEVLSDKSKFECIPDDHTIEREAKLQRSLLSLNKAGNLPTHIYNKIRPTGSRIGTLYGLRKVHKGINPPPAGRPIISAIGTYTYDTAKYLVSILKPLRDEAKYSLKDTFDLCSRLKKANEEDELKHCQMVSYDIVSLFTNVPINETIDIILEKAFSIKHRSVVKRTRTVFDRVEVKRKGRKGPNYRPTYELVPREITESVEQFNGLEKHQLKKLLVICTQKSHFQFKGNFFDQIDGVAMGSPLGPTFAEMFMAYFEEKYMELRAIFYKSHIWSKKKVFWCKNGVFFRILHEILSDNMVSVYFFGPHFYPIGVGSKFSLTIWPFSLKPS